MAKKTRRDGLGEARRALDAAADRNARAAKHLEDMLAMARLARAAKAERDRRAILAVAERGIS